MIRCVPFFIGLAAHPQVSIAQGLGAFLDQLGPKDRTDPRHLDEARLGSGPPTATTPFADRVLLHSRWTERDGSDRGFDRKTNLAIHAKRRAISWYDPSKSNGIAL